MTTVPGTRYRVYSQYLKNKYGETVYKLPINLPGTCPNRDGIKGKGGCIFCDEQGAGFDALSPVLTVEEQLARNKDYYRRRFGARKFISYFQSYSNTYLPVEQFRENLLKAWGEDMVGISVSTRPDCITQGHLDALEEIRETKGADIDVELGLQTVNYRTLEKINRGHTLGEFVDAANRVKGRGFNLCVHMILNLPGDEITDVIEGAKVLSAFQVDYVKLHSLYIVEGTKLGELYRSGEISVCSFGEYVERVAAFIRYLRPDTVIQRLAAKGPKGKVLFCNWGLDYREVLQAVESFLEEKDIRQGTDFTYLS